MKSDLVIVAGFFYLKGETMEFLKEAVTLLQTIVCMLGAAIAIVGMVNYAQGQSGANGSKKDDGIAQFMGGGAIILIGMTLVPKLVDFFVV